MEMDQFCGFLCIIFSSVEEDDYRLETLVRVRRLGRLDKDPFDEDEREQAQEKYEEMMEAANEDDAAADE